MRDVACMQVVRAHVVCVCMRCVYCVVCEGIMYIITIYNIYMLSNAHTIKIVLHTLLISVMNFLDWVIFIFVAIRC